jgi:hypothetical protein
MVSIQVATSNHDIRLSGEPRMTPNRQCPAYALFAQSWLPCCAANSASASSSSPMEYLAHRMDLSRLWIKIGRQDNHRTGGGPQILSAFVKQRTYQPPSDGNSAHPGFQAIRESFWEGSAKFGLRRLGEYHANHAIFPRVMLHLKVLKVHIFPRRGEPAPLSEVEWGISQAAKTTATHQGPGNFTWRRILPDRGSSLGGTLARRDHQEQDEPDQLPRGRCGNQKLPA